MNTPDSNTCWEALYEAKSAKLVLYGRALGLSHCEAEDVLQETFIALVKSNYRAANAEHYCLRAFRNRALHYRRGLWRRLRRELESQRWFEPSRPALEGEREAMRELTLLPQEQREVVVLKIWHSYTFEQIAEIQGASPNTVAGRYRYALQKLRHRLRGLEDEKRIGGAIAFLGTASSVPES